VRRIAACAAVASLVLGPACRKSEPDEIVTLPRQNAPPPAPSGGGSGAVGAGGVPGFGGTGGLAGAAGAPVSSIECEDSPSVVEGPFTKAKLLEAAGTCAMGHYCRFGRAAENLRHRAAAYALDPAPARADAARQAWVEAMISWEESEIFRFGPAAPAPQGQDLRDLIYAWPRDLRCKVDEQTVNRFFATETFFGPPSESFVTGRSLAALEYLLFNPGSDNGCTQFSAINANGGWAALVASGELATRKAEYTGAAAQDVLNTAKALIGVWDPEQGNYYRRLVAPGTGDSEFADEQAALNAVNYGLFYLEKEIKDLKLAIPMGVSLECTATSCPDRVESRYAGAAVRGLATQHIRANLVGFRRLFQGCGADGSGIGFDDWLSAVGAGELADRMVQAIDAAESAVAALDPPLPEAVVSHPDRVMAVYDAIKAISDPLKSEFLSVLNLEVPKGSETDND
jgi:uncharacterized protein